MAPKTHKALVIPAKFAPFIIDPAFPTPKVGPRKILVKVKSVGLTPADWKIQKFGVIVTEFPGLVGLNASGEVVEVGEGVTEVAPGDRV